MNKNISLNFLNNLNTKVDFIHGRRLVDKNKHSYKIKTIYLNFQKQLSSEKITQKEANRILKKLQTLDKEASEKLNRSSFFTKWITKIFRQALGNMGFNKTKTVEAIQKQINALPKEKSQPPLDEVSEEEKPNTDDTESSSSSTDDDLLEEEPTQKQINALPKEKSQPPLDEVSEEKKPNTDDPESSSSSTDDDFLEEESTQKQLNALPKEKSQPPLDEVSEEKKPNADDTESSSSSTDEDLLEEDRASPELMNPLPKTKLDSPSKEETLKAIEKKAKEEKRLKELEIAKPAIESAVMDQLKPLFKSDGFAIDQFSKRNLLLNRLKVELPHMKQEDMESIACEIYTQQFLQNMKPFVADPYWNDYASKMLSEILPVEFPKRDLSHLQKAITQTKNAFLEEALHESGQGSNNVWNEYLKNKRAKLSKPDSDSPLKTQLISSFKTYNSLKSIGEIHKEVKQFLDPYLKGEVPENYALKRQPLIHLLKEKFKEFNEIELENIAYDAYVSIALESLKTSVFKETWTSDVTYLLKQALAIDLPGKDLSRLRTEVDEAKRLFLKPVKIKYEVQITKFLTKISPNRLFRVSHGVLMDMLKSSFHWIDKKTLEEVAAKYIIKQYVTQNGASALDPKQSQHFYKRLEEMLNQTFPNFPKDTVEKIKKSATLFQESVSKEVDAFIQGKQKTPIVETLKMQFPRVNPQQLEKVAYQQFLSQYFEKNAEFAKNSTWENQMPTQITPLLKQAFPNKNLSDLTMQVRIAKATLANRSSQTIGKTTHEEEGIGTIMYNMISGVPTALRSILFD